ncbi:hypothetical protein [Streptomyces sp. URMC 124]|uniref:hypothetical protein n=1 Tax=Streptomyces sp. URMC 124 TaxID=3423405 RepID=UPI003F1D895A
MGCDDHRASVKRPRAIKRAQVAPGPLRDLKDLLFEAYLAAGLPSLDEIAKDVAADDNLAGAPKRDTIHRCLSTAELPPSLADVVSIAAVLGRMAGLAETDLTSRVNDLWIRARLARPVGQLVSELTDPFVLEVHQSIQMNQGDESPSLPLLPIYVEREHDQRLRAIVQKAAHGDSQLAVLVGDSSTGKTRACWEALREIPADWRLWHPIDPGRPDAALAEMERVGPRTVIWLNESQHYLLTPGIPLGERVSAGLRSLLRDPNRQPVLVLGTMWPAFWARLTTQPDRNEPDVHSQARTLLDGRGIPVPALFDGEDLIALRAASTRDPRLAYATDRAEKGQVTQYLAGAPALLDRYRAAPVAARALVEAAMDARRLGHAFTLPRPLLEVAAGGYLTDQQWDLLPDNWLADGLTYTGYQIRGARGPLSLIRHRSGEQSPAQPHYRLADYLEQYALRSRRTVRTPTALWEALIQHATPESYTTLAQAAHSRGLIRICVLLCNAGAEKGNNEALSFGYQVLTRSGRSNEAALWNRHRRPSATFTRQWQGASEGLKEWQVGRQNPIAESLCRDAQKEVKAQNHSAAITLYQRAIAAGSTSGLAQLAALLNEMGRASDALDILDSRTRQGDQQAPWIAINVLNSSGRLDEALSWYERIAETGTPRALTRAACRLAFAGRTEEALAWYERAFTSGHTDASWGAAHLLRRKGRTAEAASWHARRANAGDAEGFLAAAELLEDTDQETALEQCHQAAVMGHPDALPSAIRLLRKMSRQLEADLLQKHGWEPDGSIAAPWEAPIPSDQRKA